jgi:hypothetical protein
MFLTYFGKKGQCCGQEILGSFCLLLDSKRQADGLLALRQKLNVAF